MQVTTTYLEQTSLEQLSPAVATHEPLSVERAEEPSPEFTRFLLTAVGGQWHWTEKLGWTWHQWHDWITREGFETWVGHVRGTPIGYAELYGRPATGGTEVEVESFGLLPAFIGRGLGGTLLTEVLRAAWSIDSRWSALPAVSRVWLHTCTLDSAHALPNYLARGLRPYDRRTTEQDIGATPPGPWPGSQPADRPTAAAHEGAPRPRT